MQKTDAKLGIKKMTTSALYLTAMLQRTENLQGTYTLDDTRKIGNVEKRDEVHSQKYEAWIRQHRPMQ